MYGQFQYFGPKLPKNCISNLRQKKERHDRIQHIRNSLTIKFQLKETNLNFWTKLAKKIWILSKYFLNTFLLTTKCDKKTSHTLFGPFSKTLLQIVANRESFTNFKLIITKCDKALLQSVTGITKWDRIYYKVWEVLQSVTVITKRNLTSARSIKGLWKFNTKAKFSFYKKRFIFLPLWLHTAWNMPKYEISLTRIFPYKDRIYDHSKH